MMAQPTLFGPIHQVDRKNMFNEVLKLFEDPHALKEYPLMISFVNEAGYDIGGLLRDMLSEFWQLTYIQMFDGGNQLTPSVHPQTDMSVFTALGRIMSHGYIISGVLPLQIAFPTLAGALLGPGVQVDDHILITTFANSLSASEAQLVKDSLKVKGSQFDVALREKLVDLLSRYGAREIPTPAGFKAQLLQTAKYEFSIKPIPAMSSMHSGIIEEDRAFWASFSTNDLFDLYNLLTADS